MRPIQDLRSHAFDLATAFDCKIVEWSAKRLEEMDVDINMEFGLTFMAEKMLQGEAARGLQLLPPSLRARLNLVNTIHVRPIVTLRRYAIVLHELGHAIGPGGHVREVATCDNINLKLHEEEMAWRWARHYALVWTPEMDEVEKKGMDSYVELARKLGTPRVRESLNDFLRRREEK